MAGAGGEAGLAVAAGSAPQMVLEIGDATVCSLGANRASEDGVLAAPVAFVSPDAESLVAKTPEVVRSNLFSASRSDASSEACFAGLLPGDVTSPASASSPSLSPQRRWKGWQGSDLERHHEQQRERRSAKRQALVEELDRRERSQCTFAPQLVARTSPRDAARKPRASATPLENHSQRVQRMERLAYCYYGGYFETPRASKSLRSLHSAPSAASVSSVAAAPAAAGGSPAAAAGSSQPALSSSTLPCYLSSGTLASTASVSRLAASSRCASEASSLRSGCAGGNGHAGAGAGSATGQASGAACGSSAGKVAEKTMRPRRASSSTPSFGSKNGLPPSRLRLSLNASAASVTAATSTADAASEATATPRSERSLSAGPSSLLRSRRMLWQRFEAEVRDAFLAAADGGTKTDRAAMEASAVSLAPAQLAPFLERLRCLPAGEPAAREAARRLHFKLWSCLDPDGTGHITLQTATHFLKLLLLGAVEPDEEPFSPPSSRGGNSCESPKPDFDAQRLRAEFGELCAWRMSQAPPSSFRKEAEPVFGERQSRKSAPAGSPCASAPALTRAASHEARLERWRTGLDDWKAGLEARLVVMREQQRAEELAACTFQPSLCKGGKPSASARQAAANGGGTSPAGSNARLACVASESGDASSSPAAASAPGVASAASAANGRPRRPSVHEELYQRSSCTQQLRRASTAQAQQRRSFAESASCTFRPDTQRSQRSFRLSCGPAAAYPRGYRQNSQRLREGALRRSEAAYVESERMAVPRNGILARDFTPSGRMVAADAEDFAREAVQHSAGASVVPELANEVSGRQDVPAMRRALSAPPKSLEWADGCSGTAANLPRHCLEPDVQYEASPPAPVSPVSPRSPRLTLGVDEFCIEVRISPDKPPVPLTLRKGESAREAAAEFAVHHALPPQLAQRLLTMLERHLGPPSPPPGG